MSYEPTRESFSSQYVFFKLTDNDLKTGTMIFHLILKISGNEVGCIKWYEKANAYCFFPRPKVCYNGILLKETSQACIDLTREHEVRLRTRKN